jgi:LPS-assembly protein
VKTRSIRFYPGDRVVMTNTTLYVGQTPILWFPLLYADLNRSGFQFLPGYDSRWGAYLLLSYSFPVTEGIDAAVRLEERTEFGPSIGLDLNMKYGPGGRNFGNLVADYVFETKDVTTVEAPGEPAETRTTDRYRVSFQQRLFLTDDIYGTADVNWISDVDFLEDFYPQDYRNDPQPDTSLSLTKWDEDYTLTLLGRWQVNDFQDTTERKPELVFDFKNQSFFGLPLQYDGETGVAQLRRAFSNTPQFGETEFPDYQATRFDTFHQWSLPSQLFGWLNVNPRAGIRGTYYSASGLIRRTTPPQTWIRMARYSGRLQITEFPFRPNSPALLSRFKAVLWLWTVSDMCSSLTLTILGFIIWAQGRKTSTNSTALPRQLNPCLSIFLNFTRSIRSGLGISPGWGSTSASRHAAITTPTNG